MTGENIYGCGGGFKEVGYLNDNGYQLTPLLGKYFDNI